ncbi:MAG: hypothetical protein C5B59_06095 [Bacteroidetes bacterium]|nr:MAG: hypothetical protein C5B59_06095 [Bacteroidota bacterium]
MSNVDNKTVNQQIDQLYRSHFGKMVAWLLYFSKDIQLERAEDIVQDAFASSLIAWQKDGMPQNPPGWIFKVCRNKAINQIRDKKKILHTNGQIHDPFVDYEISETILDDQQLQLLFACAHPDLSPKAQVVITLKYIASLKVEAIANVLGMTIDGVDKLLSRSRQKIREERIMLELPSKSKLGERLPIVHKIIYLIFNEGYKSSSGKELLREELCEDALLLTKELIDKNLGNNETLALYSLMLFNAARFKARFGPAGEIKDLEEQDRSQWDKKLILMGCHYLERSKGEVISSFHYEATIAYFHSRETHFRDTNWQAITQLYLQLMQINASPFIELNYAIALYYAGQKPQAIQKLHELEQRALLNQYYLLNASLGKIYFNEGNLDRAKSYYLKTLHQTNFQVEKDYISKMIDKIEARQNGTQRKSGETEWRTTG